MPWKIITCNKTSTVVERQRDTTWMIGQPTLISDRIFGHVDSSEIKQEHDI